MDETKEIDIDLRKIFYMMRTKIIYILLITVLVGVAAGGYTHFFIDPTYNATVKMYVYSNTDRATSDTSITPNEINASKELVNTYIYVLESDTVLSKVATDLNLNLSPASIRSMINASLIEDTQAFQVTVTSTDRNLAANVANSIAKVAPDEIVRVVKAGGVEIIDKAEVPNSPSSPNLKKNIIVGALAGFLASFLLFFIYEMFDSTITNAKDLEREFDIPVLGTIPRLESVEKEQSNSGTGTGPQLEKPARSIRSRSTQGPVKSTKGDVNNGK